MKGLELAKYYYENVGKPMLEQCFPEYLSEVAVGLVGEGSECFGYDDEISQDHDFGARFCIWLPLKIYEEIGEQMQQEYTLLREPFMGYFPVSDCDAGGIQRSGVFSISNFYGNLLHQIPLPKKEKDWLFFRESALAAETNGEVFVDSKGIFTSIRRILKGYYPENIRLKKLAGSLSYMAQTGQVNYERCVKRGDVFTANICWGEFTKASLHTLYLLNKRYMPFYKWASKGLENSEVLPEGIMMLKNMENKRSGNRMEAIENFCHCITKELNEQQLSTSQNNFLVMQALQVHDKINNAEIFKMPIYMPEFPGEYI